MRARLSGRIRNYFEWKKNTKIRVAVHFGNWFVLWFGVDFQTLESQVHFVLSHLLCTEAPLWLFVHVFWLFQYFSFFSLYTSLKCLSKYRNSAMKILIWSIIMALMWSLAAIAIHGMAFNLHKIRKCKWHDGPNTFVTQRVQNFNKIMPVIHTCSAISDHLFSGIVIFLWQPHRLLEITKFFVRLKRRRARRKFKKNCDKWTKLKQSKCEMWLAR